MSFNISEDHLTDAMCSECQEPLLSGSSTKVTKKGLDLAALSQEIEQADSHLVAVRQVESPTRRFLARLNDKHFNL